MKKICKSCGKELDISCFTKSKKFKDGHEIRCKECYSKERKKYVRTCTICGKEFKARKKDAKYCSYTCAGMAIKKKIKCKCDGCGKEIEVFPSVLKKRKHVFCSKGCYRKNIDKCSKKVHMQLQPGSKKVCKGCGKLLDISCFTRDSRLKDGYKNKCKKCRQEQRKKYIKICNNCGNQFRTAYKNAKYCSNKCNTESQKKRIKVKCFMCGKEIEMTPSQADARVHCFCSKKCESKWRQIAYSGESNPSYKPKIKCICDVCGKEFYRTQSEFKYYKKHYCSIECQHIGNTSTLEKNRKLRENKVKVKCDYCGKEFLTVPSKIKVSEHNYCSIECKNRGWSKYYSGENSPQWNFDKTNEERIVGRAYYEYGEWRKKVYKRDNYTCQCCRDDRGGNLVAHHILNYSEHKRLRIEISNGITLCKKCHKKFHDTNGYKHNNAKQLQEFFRTQSSKNQLVIPNMQEFKLLKGMLK